MRAPNTKTVGERTEAIVMAALLRTYDAVLVPFGDNQRYDLVIDTGDGFVTIQCKTGRLRKGSILFPTASSSEHRTRGSRRSYYGEVDYFGVYCPGTDAVYLVPVNDVGPNGACLRVEPTRNGQSRGVKWARDYELTTAGADLVPTTKKNSLRLVKSSDEAAE